MKPKCPECSCTMTVVSNQMVCDDPECAYVMNIEDEACQPNPEGLFHKELTQLINRYSKENGSNTPDFLLAN
jgi:hypothetical protein